MEVRHTVQRFPGAAFLLILGLTVALAAVVTLSIGGWGLSIASPVNPGTPTTQTQPAVQIQQPIATPQPCTGTFSECSS